MSQSARELRSGQYRDNSNLDARLALHQRFGTNPGNFHHWLFDRMQLKDGQRVLDVGAGLGTLWRENASRLPALWLALSDGSPGMATDTRGHLAVAAPWVVFDVQAVAHPPDTFDVVIANHMLYHPEDRGRALAELRRVLRPGGTLYASTNGRKHMRELYDIAADCVSGYAGVDHVERFGLETGPPQLAEHFDDVTVEPYDNSLLVTEVEPLVAYLASMDGNNTPDMELIRARVEEQFEREGGTVRISTDGGLITAK